MNAKNSLKMRRKTFHNWVRLWQDGRWAVKSNSGYLSLSGFDHEDDYEEICSGLIKG